jgi:serine protease Do
VDLAVARADDAAGADPVRAAAIARAKEIERDIERTIAVTSPAYVVVGGGSGVIFTDDGWILTNHHVVAGRAIGDLFWLRRPGGRALRAKLIGWDPRGDIALLKAEGVKEKLPFAPLGDSEKVEVGDLAIALGNPFGFARDAHPTATLGIVSAVHSYQDTYSDAIQTDAPINPGNSGGPLLNLKGEVIGINGRVAVRFGNRMNTGVGYAIPSNQIQAFLPRLKQGGTVRHGHLPGVVFRGGPDGKGGTIVERVQGGSPAEKAGLKAGDVVVKIADRDVPVPARAHGIIGTVPGGDTVQIVVRRSASTGAEGDGAATGSQEVTLSVRIEPLAEQRGADPDSAFLGIQLGGQVEGDGGGVAIQGVIAESGAAKAGVLAGDVLLRFDGAAVTNGEELIALIQQKKPGDKVDLDLVRGGKPLTITAELGRRGQR